MLIVVFFYLLLLFEVLILYCVMLMLLDEDLVIRGFLLLGQGLRLSRARGFILLFIRLMLR